MEFFFVVLVFSIIQSIFGVGLLLFGTPTLLLMGVDFEQSLWILLPSSIAISLYQVVDKYSLIKTKKEIYLYVIPSLAVGLSIVVLGNSVFDIQKVVGLFLLLIGIIRSSKKLRIVLRIFIQKYMEIYLIIMGFVHGISNMGGGMLTVLMSSTYIKKDMVQSNIAYSYLLFGLTQLSVLSVLGSSQFSNYVVLFTLTSLLISFLTNRYLMVLISNFKFQLSITSLVFIYGILALVK